MEQMMEYVPNMYATFWALVPPLVAIILALVTKEVYSSLFIGIVIGGLFYGNIFQQGFSFEKSVLHRWYNLPQRSAYTRYRYIKVPAIYLF
jgi:tetracycline resistance efflux pump